MSTLQNLHEVITELEATDRTDLANTLGNVFTRLARAVGRGEYDDAYVFRTPYHTKLDSAGFEDCKACEGIGWFPKYNDEGIQIPGARQCEDCGGEGRVRRISPHARHQVVSSIRVTTAKRGKLPSREVEYGHKSPPKGYPKKKKEYADPKNYKYPLDTEAHVRAAYSYLSMPKNQKMYTSLEIQAMMAKIRRAGKKYGITFSKEKKKD